MMKTGNGILSVLFACLTTVTIGLTAIAADTRSLGPLPDADCADTEVTTNVAFAVDRESHGAVRIALGCEASATNGLEVMIGCDANADGFLSHEESDLAFGYDCGEWFTRHADTSTVEAESESRTNRVSREFLLKCRSIPSSWNLLRIIRRGGIAANETITVAFDRKRFQVILR